MYVSQKLIKEFSCMDCHICTLCNGEYYMVKNNIWKVANPKIDGMLCITCLEKRLGRKLVPKDFSKCDLNKEALLGVIERSRKILNRMKGY